LNPTEKARLSIDRSSSFPIDQQCEIVGTAKFERMFPAHGESRNIFTINSFEWCFIKYL